MGRVDYIVDSRLFQFTEEAISTELNVLVHEDCIHTHEVEWEHLLHSQMKGSSIWMALSSNNLPDADRPRRFEQAVVEDTGKVTIKSFIMAE
jgi:hypothetical protein